MKQLTVVLAALLAGVLSGAPAQVATPPTAAPPPTSIPAVRTGTYHHRVLWLGNPQTEATLSWTTGTSGSAHRIHYDTVSRGGDPALYASQQKSFKDGQYTMVEGDEKWAAPGFYHHSRLTGLQPDTTYYVVFASDTSVSPEFQFRTAPTDDKDFSLLFGGDSRIGGSEPYEHNDRRGMNKRLAAIFEAEPDVYALVHGGDYCMLAEWRYINPWLSDHELTTTTSGRLLPIIPTRGNHDRGVVFEEKFPSTDPAFKYYHESHISNRLSIVVLNTEISLAGDQRDWLDQTLTRVRPSHNWVVASYHRPSYPSVRAAEDGAPRRENWVPLFEKHNIDLVLESHDHALKRTLPIRNGAPDLETGITYIGDGGLGVPQRKPDPTRWWLAEPGMTQSVHHCHLLRFGADTMHVTAYGMDGAVLDDFQLKRRSAPAQP